MNTFKYTTGEEIILAAELAGYDLPDQPEPPTFEPTIYDAFAMRALGVDIDAQDDRTTEAS